MNSRLFPKLACLAIIASLTLPASASARHPDHEPNELVSIVFLLERPRQLEAADIRAAAERAFGVEFHDNEDAESFVLRVDQPGHPTFFPVVFEGTTLGVLYSGRPYLEDPAAAADATPDLRLKKALQQHKAWLAIDWFDDPPHDLDAAYRLLGRLAAEVAGEDCMAVYAPQAGRLVAYEPDTPDLLRGEEPFEVFGIHVAPVINISPDDPAMAAAVAEAVRRWPEFVEAFNRRQPGESFAAKFRFTDGEESEFMWIAVTRIDGDKVTGRLDNIPVSVRNVRHGDEVTMRLDELNDWIYRSETETTGGFTIKVLEAEAGKQRRREK